MVKAKSSKKKQSSKPVVSKKANDDFIMTISDSEEDVPNLDFEEEELEKTAPKKKKKQQSIEEPEDIDPEFDFDLDGTDKKTSEFTGWDFNADQDSTRVDVDLDDIIRRKGGLEHAEMDQSESEPEESDDDDDDLAMDGFGMGVSQEDGDGDEGVEGEDDEAEDEEEDEDDEDDDDDDENEEDKPQGGNEDDDGDEEKDTAEEMAKYYAPTEEAEKAKNVIHKDFNNLSLSRPVIRGISNLGYTQPTKIQSSVIPIALLGKDIVAGAITGSGKTAAYIVPILERLVYRPKNVASTRVLILTPTRELAVQVCDAGRKLAKYVGGVRFAQAVGGMNLRAQEKELKTRPDVVVATPGRLLDHIMNSPSFQVDTLEILVVDEADRMLDEGFQKELTEILSLIPAKRQTMLFSATMNSSIKDLIRLSMKKPVRIMLDAPKRAAGGLVQEFARIRKREALKPAVLYHILKKIDTNERVIVFVARKEMAHKLRIILGLLGVRVGELHGSRTQEQRNAAIDQFNKLEVSVLVCTDVAARGLDIPKIELVVNYDMPSSHETYVHRVGRTARAGRTGRSISFVGESTSDRKVVKEAIKSAQETKNQAIGREVDWTSVQQIGEIIDSKLETVKEILSEEKQEKEILAAERDVKKGENMIKHRDEIMSRPKRTWFQSEKEKKEDKKKNQASTNKKRKLDKARDLGPRLYSKTAADRAANSKP